ncbi:hypothetical protein AB0N17_29180 [Streptomyces sp. NPDC051133]|uniref:YxiG-like protein n=1 Tax=Streptomyces sp. NPDC051133 TaxID=3155521 RepID=UPI0034184C9F
MDTAVLQRLLDDLAADRAVVHHGYTTYMRDYEMFVYMTADPRTGVPPAYVRYLFRHCVRAHCETTVAPDTWRVSLDDRLLDHETANDLDLDGYVWGVNCHAAWEAELLPESEEARRWARDLGVDFHEVRVESNAQSLTLLFSELEVSEVPVGYAPFVTDQRRARGPQ